MLESYADINGHGKLHYIPCSVNTKEITYNQLLRNEIRVRNGWQDSIVLVYLGSMSQNFWNDPQVYFDFIKELSKSVKKLHLLILTTDAVPVSKLLSDRGLPADMVTITSAGHLELSGWLSAADFGLQLMKPAYDAKSRLGVKFVEYLAAGLPVITNPFAGAAHDLVIENKVGIPLDESGRLTPVDVDMIKNSNVWPRDVIRAFAIKNFDTNVISDAYKQIYIDLTC